MNSKEDKKYIMYITDNKADTVAKFRATTFSETEMTEIYNRTNYNNAREQYAELALFDKSTHIRKAAMRSCSGALYNQASQDNLVDNGYEFFNKKKKEIEQNPTLALLDPYETFRKMATQKLQGLK